MDNCRQVFCEHREVVGGVRCHRLRIVSVEANQRGVGDLCCHLLEREAEDDGRVETHPELQEQQPFVTLQEGTFWWDSYQKVGFVKASDLAGNDFNED